jgi:hypothetical protein
VGAQLQLQLVGGDHPLELGDVDGLEQGPGILRELAGRPAREEAAVAQLEAPPRAWRATQRREETPRARLAVTQQEAPTQLV